jgi:hypothetical protein
LLSSISFGESRIEKLFLRTLVLYVCLKGGKKDLRRRREIGESFRSLQRFQSFGNGADEAREAL